MEEKKLTGYPSVDKPWLKYYSEEAINAKLPKDTIYGYMHSCNEDGLNDVALEYFGKATTYRQLFERIDEAARAFKHIGVAVGDVVSLCLLATPETVYAFYALNRIGAVINIIEPRTNPEQIQKRINAADSRFVVIVDVFFGRISPILAETKVEKVIVVSLADSMAILQRNIFSLTVGRRIPVISSSNSVLRWPNFIQAGTAYTMPMSVKHAKSTLSVIIYTGGTTGTPKGTMLSNDGFNAMAIQQKYGNAMIQAGESFLDIMPPFIAYGLTFGMHLPLCTHLRVILIPKFDAKAFDKLVLKHKPNHILGVPSFMETLVKSKKLNRHDLSFLITATVGGDALSPEVEREINTIFKCKGCKTSLFKGYGMTELGSAATYTVTDACNKLGSVGIPLVKTTIKIVHPHTQEELPYYEKGEICLSSPTMMLGYFQHDLETKQVVQKHTDGYDYVHSGDIGYMDKDGVLFIIDRMKRMTIRPDGHNVWPSQIEAVISQHSSVTACAVVGKPNPNGANGQIPTAYIVLKVGVNGTESLMREIDALSKEHLPERDVALAYHFIDALPLTPIGKIDYRALERLEPNDRIRIEDR